MTELHALFDPDFQAYLHGPALLAGLAAMGMAVGVLTGLFGVGGAFMVTPMLNVIFGIPYELAIGSSLSFTIGTSCAGLRRHIRLDNFEPRSTVILAGAGMVGAVGGATLNKFLSTAVGPADYTLVMHGLFVVILALTAWLVGRKTSANRAKGSLLQRLPLRPKIDLPGAGLAGLSLPGMCLMGCGIGITTGMLGIGGGVLFMPVLVLAIGLTPHQAVGTSLGVVVFSAIVAAMKYAADGHVNMWIVMSLLVSSVVGVQVGAWVCDRLDATKLRRWFAVLVAMVAMAVAVRLAIDLLV